MAFNFGPISIVIAAILSLIAAWASYYNSDKIVLKLSNARPATHEENQKLVNILDSLMLTSGLAHKPKLYVVEDRQPNAFATGRNPENSVICVTTGLLQKLDYYELEGVIAHELSHIANYDIRLSAVVTVMVGLIVILSDMFSRILIRGGNRKSSNNKGSGNAILMIIGIICLILAPIFGEIMRLALSRRREYLADATSVSYTRNPNGLISALQKLDQDQNQLRTASNGTSHMYIVNPFKKIDGKKKKNSLFSTHPTIESRIESIKNIS